LKVTKNNIIKAVKEATGISTELNKFDGTYYWGGSTACLFKEASTNYTTLTHPNLTIESFVDDFKEKIKEIENEYEDKIENIVNKTKEDIL